MAQLNRGPVLCKTKDHFVSLLFQSPKFETSQHVQFNVFLFSFICWTVYHVVRSSALKSQQVNLEDKWHILLCLMTSLTMLSSRVIIFFNTEHIINCNLCVHYIFTLTLSSWNVPPNPTWLVSPGNFNELSSVLRIT